MKIKIRTIAGKDLELDVEHDYTVLDVKNDIEQAELIPPVQQRLVCNGRVLINDKATMEECNIVNGNVIHMVLALRGG